MVKPSVMAGLRRRMSEVCARTYASSAGEQKVTTAEIARKYRRGEHLTCVTAYDYPTGLHVDKAGMDMCLIGDSAAMVVHGHDTTQPLTVEDMVSHCKAVSRGCKRALRIGDMPFGSYEAGSSEAVRAACRLVKEGAAEAVKLEGATQSSLGACSAISQAGIATMGHIGLTPQSISTMGGFRPQGRTSNAASELVKGAMELERAGAFSIVLECIPEPVSAAITASVSVPTIGIGAGRETSGQVLVFHDMIGLSSHPHHAHVAPRFCKQYANVGDAIASALASFRSEVVSGSFPSRHFSPYELRSDAKDAFCRDLRSLGLTFAADAAENSSLRRSAEDDAPGRA